MSADQHVTIYRRDTNSYASRTATFLESGELVFLGPTTYQPAPARQDAGRRPDESKPKAPTSSCGGGCGGDASAPRETYGGIELTRWPTGWRRIFALGLSPRWIGDAYQTRRLRPGLTKRFPWLLRPTVEKPGCGCLYKAKVLWRALRA